MEENKDYGAVLTLIGCIERWGQDRGRKIYDGLIRQTILVNDGVGNKDIHAVKTDNNGRE